MNIFTLSPKAKPRAIFLLPENICNLSAANFLFTKLIQPLGLNLMDFAFAAAFTPEKGKLKKADFVEEFKVLDEYCETMGINIIAVGNADYYQNLTRDKKMLLNIGRVLPSNGVTSDLSIIPILNPVILNMFPARAKELTRGVAVVKNLLSGDYKDPVQTLSLSVNEILKSPDEVHNYLKNWFNEPELFVDIETTGLRWYGDSLLTISFARNEREAFCVAIHEKYHSPESYKKIVKILKSFFEQYKGKLVGHNWVGFDQAFITHEIMRGGDFTIPHYDIINKFRLEDSMIMAHIILNSTEKPSIGLKELSFPFMGEYDADIDQKNLYSADLAKVGLYNNYDVIATCKIWRQLNKQLDEDTENLRPVYDEFIEIGTSLLKMKMNGLRIEKDKVEDSVIELSRLVKSREEKFKEHPIIKKAEEVVAKKRFTKHNSTLKNKKKWEDCKDSFIEAFNPGSPLQKQILFFELMQLPIIKKSKTSGAPSTDADVVEEWFNTDLTDEQVEILTLITDIQSADKVNSTYLKVFQSSSIEVSPNHWKVFANFNQTGTISGRLSSSGGLNFQNLPSNSIYGPLIKKLLIPDDGFIIGAVDYSALEDRLIAIEANDKNKIRIFSENIDGHCLNAYAYFKDKLEEREIIINPDDPASINSIKKLAPDLRQAGKGVTFGMSYGSGANKISQQLKITVEEAQTIYNGYWELYPGIYAYNQQAIKEARENGYVMSKFSGMRVKLASINAQNDYIRGKEERRAPNFKIQSGNFLTLRGLHKFQLELEKNNMVDKIKICNTVHDSIKLQMLKTTEIIEWANNSLIKILCEDYKENQPIKLEAELDVGINEKDMRTLKNNASTEEIEECILELSKINGKVEE